MLTYPAHIMKEDDAFLVTFPDLENIVTFGATLDEALQNAEDALNGCLASDFERNFSIPEPSNITGEYIHHVYGAIQKSADKTGSVDDDIAEAVVFARQ
jgi:antitoxin HicB